VGRKEGHAWRTGPSRTGNAKNHEAQDRIGKREASSPKEESKVTKRLKQQVLPRRATLGKGKAWARGDRTLREIHHDARRVTEKKEAPLQPLEPFQARSTSLGLHGQERRD